MGVCGSKTPAVKQDVPAAHAQNGNVQNPKQPAVSLPQPTAPKVPEVTPTRLQQSAISTAVSHSE